MSLFLAIDTSLCGLVLGLFARSDSGMSSSLIWSKVHLEAAGAAQMLAKYLSSGLAESGHQKEEISGIMVGHGPGSFTGIRVGLAFASGLQAGFTGLKPPIVGVSSLQLFAERVHRENSLHSSLSSQVPTVAVLAGTRTAGYIAVVENGSPSQLVAFDLENTGTPAEAMKFIKDRAPCRVVLCGEWPGFRDLFSTSTEVLATEIAAVAEQALYGMGEYGDQLKWEHAGPSMLAPLYLRRSTVEERFERGGN